MLPVASPGGVGESHLQSVHPIDVSGPPSVARRPRRTPSALLTVLESEFNLGIVAGRVFWVRIQLVGLPVSAFLAVTLALARPCVGQSQTVGEVEASDPAQPPRLRRGEIVLDGRPSEPAWEGAWAVPRFHQVVPNEGEAPSES